MSKPVYVYSSVNTGLSSKLLNFGASLERKLCCPSVYSGTGEMDNQQIHMKKLAQCGIGGGRRGVLSLMWLMYYIIL